MRWVVFARQPAAWRELRRLADKAEPGFQRMILSAFRAAGDALPLAELVQAIEANDVYLISDILVGSNLGQLRPAVIRATRDLLEAGADSTVAAVSGAIRRGDSEVGFAFDVLNPRVVEFIDQRTGRLITGISDSQREVVRSIIRRGMVEGRDVRRLAREIRETVGILPQHELTLQRLAADGATEAQLAKARRFYQNYRSKMIARTEVMTAFNRGAAEAWRQAAEAGLVDKDVARVEWITTQDDRTCPICAPLDREMRHLDGQFSIGYDPPAHPMCRCVPALRPFGEGGRRL